ncbi:MAG TPA: hypothetical protein VFB63_29385 [Bryobacteraceae bacterium]|nr:hypothetical protein [Bryobacteraceae bacterium]
MLTRLALFLLAIGTEISAAILPDRLAEYTRGNLSRAPITAADRALFDEYLLRETEAAAYFGPGGRVMQTEVFRFGTAEGGHAAFLWLRPAGAVQSPLGATTTRGRIFGESHAVVSGGKTVIQWQNYVFRFQGAAPSRNALEGMLDGLPNVDAFELDPDYCCAYFVESSERIILGPVSLARFAQRIPPSVAAFRLGARARLATYETPTGTISRVVFEYPTQAIAEERINDFRSLPDALVRIEGKKIGIVFAPPDIEEAQRLLGDIVYDGTRGETAFDLSTMTHGPMTLDEGMAYVAWGFILGAIVGFLRGYSQRRLGIPNHTISLDLSN